MDTAGHIYIFEVRSNHIKIGRSKNPVRRIKGFINTLGEIPIRSWISPKCLNFCQLENKLHREFKAQRLRGEYFHVDFDNAKSMAMRMYFKPLDGALT